MNRLNQLNLAQIRQCLKSPTALTYDVPRLWSEQASQKAAVLLPLIRKDEAWHLLFIRRAEHEHDHHSGQVAFAGGKYERDDESLHATALREAHEEIGVDPEHVHILGELGHHHSISRFQITPVVGHMPWPYKLNLDRQEVARTFTIPLNWLADKSNYRLEQRYFEQQQFAVVYFEEYDREVLWGATARMTLTLIEVLQQFDAAEFRDGNK